MNVPDQRANGFCRFETWRAAWSSVLDLGLALLSQEEVPAALTSTGQCFGTPDDMAPEQWNDAHTCDARTAFEAMAYQTRDVVNAMQLDSGVPLAELKVDCDASANNLLLQFQSDILPARVHRPVDGVRDPRPTLRRLATRRGQVARAVHFLNSEKQ